MKRKNKDIAEILECSKATVSLTLSGKRLVSWPLAVKLNKIFPYKGVTEWKNSTPVQIKSAFQNQSDDQLQDTIDTRRHLAKVG